MTKWMVAVGRWLITGGLLLGVARAQTTSPARQFYGTWYSYPVGNPNTDPIRHEFRHNSVTGKDEMIVSRICPGDNGTVVAKAVSPIEISDSTIRVLKAASDTEEGAGKSVCQVYIEAAVLNYTASDDGNRITITNPGGSPDLLELARQNAATAAMLSANIYGSWLLPSETTKDSKIAIRLVFYNSADSDRGTVRQIVSCTKGNDSLLSQVDSEITITKDEITILDSASHDERNGDFVCKATITAGKLHYVVSPGGGTMTLTKAGQKPMLLTRER